MATVVQQLVGTGTTAASGLPAVLTPLAVTVEEARRRLDVLAASPGPAASEVATRIAGAVGGVVANLVAEQVSQQSELAAPLLAVRERLESHLLAGSLLRASEASATAVVDVLRRGLAGLADDLSLD